MKLFKVLAFLYLYCANVSSAFVSYNDVAELKRGLLTNYSKDLRPIKDQQSPIDVMLCWYPNAINNFDEVDGILSIVSGVNVFWKDEFVSWDSGKYNFSFFKIAASYFWIPYLGIGYGADSISYHEKELDKGLVEYDFRGEAWYSSFSVTKTSCEPNMFYFPFDVHNCTVYFFPRDYRSSEVKFKNTSSGSLSQYKENNSFKMKQFSYVSYIDDSSSISFVAFNLILQRRPTFILINHLSPVLALGFVDVFAFLLPIESGERVSYAVTMFLSLAVYLTIIADKLPNNDPVPIFTYFLLGKVIYSCLIVMCVIIGLRFHYASRSSYLLKSLDWLLKKLQKSENAEAFKKEKNVSHDNVSATSDDVDGKLMSNDHSKSKEEWIEYWNKICRRFDRICFVVFLGINVTESSLWISLTLYLIQ